MQWCEGQSSLRPASCTRSAVDPESCAWYHGVWPFLRAADLVSSPTWHHDFYREQIASAAARVPAQPILVSGTADFSMPAYALAGLRGSQRAVVADQCRTPLDASEWYARRCAATIDVRQTDLLTGDLGRGFGVIVTDAFLTRFAVEDAQNLVRRWFEALAPGGSIVTTVRVRGGDDDADDHGREGFVARFRETMEHRTVGKFSGAELQDAARVYTERMTSSNLGDAESVLALFRRAGFVVTHHEVVLVPGEFAPTSYLRLVASPSARR